jgi:hypothetical protein
MTHSIIGKDGVISRPATVVVPIYLRTFARDEGLSMSALLREALENKKREFDRRVNYE